MAIEIADAKWNWHYEQPEKNKTEYQLKGAVFTISAERRQQGEQEEEEAKLFFGIFASWEGPFLRWKILANRLSWCHIE